MVKAHLQSTTHPTLRLRRIPLPPTPRAVLQTKYTKKPPKGMSDSLKDVELALAELKDVTEVARSYRGAAGRFTLCLANPRRDSTN